MPQADSILNLYGFVIEDISGPDPLVLKVRHTLVVECPDCLSSDLRIKDTFRRFVRHESFGLRSVYLHLKTHKYLCRNCGRYFNSRFPGIMPYRRTTEAFRKEVFYKHHDGISQKTLSLRLRVGHATVERYFQDFLKLKLTRSQNDPAPRVLGIDEHFFSKKDGYATTLCDLGNHKVYDVVLGRTELALKAYLETVPDKDKTKVVVMDLSETYRSIVKRHFPGAKIVADRFHVIRLLNYHFLKTWQLIDSEGRKSRGLLSLMRRHEEKLSSEQRLKLGHYFSRFPALQVIWEFKQKLARLLLMKQRTQRNVRPLIPKFLYYIRALKESPFENLAILGKTLESWSEEIVRMWRFTKSNGITEGFHNKMEMISRRAFGFRNFENYRLRVRVLCG
jgi:transposase